MDGISCRPTTISGTTTMKSDSGRTKPLKSQNFFRLVSIYFATILILVAIQVGMEETFTVIQLGKRALAAVVIVGLGAVLSHLLPNNVKHVLVYLRLRNVLSGYRCKRICRKDPRILYTDLEKKWPKLFLHDMKEDEQNAYWYKEIYQPVRNYPEVIQAHKDFLLYRDSAAGIFILLVSLLFWRILEEFIDLPSLSTMSLLALAIGFLALCLAAQQSGNRLVANAVTVALIDDKEVIV